MRGGGLRVLSGTGCKAAAAHASPHSARPRPLVPDRPRIPNLTAFENVRVAVQSRSEINDATWSLLAAVALQDRAGETCRNLSHGEQRLLEIAVTLGHAQSSKSSAWPRL
jgi:predicted ABC-type transport system involved in lysophospholipase L1 biosynthesis ATPase subunit